MKRIKATLAINGKVISQGTMKADERPEYLGQLAHREWVPYRGRIVDPIVFVSEGDELLCKYSLHQTSTRNDGEMWKHHCEFADSGFSWACITRRSGSIGITIGVKGIGTEPPGVDLSEAIPEAWLD